MTTNTSIIRKEQYNIASGKDQNTIEILQNEVVQNRGLDLFYIPRNLGGENELLGEDRISEFKNAYPIRMYFEESTGFGGQGFLNMKWSMIAEQTATLVVAKRQWSDLIRAAGKNDADNDIIPPRPCEGDLIYFPVNDNLFEIRFVDHLDPFFQTGRQFVYKLHVENFQYASEQIETGRDDIDAFEKLNTFDPARSEQGEENFDLDKVNNLGDNTEIQNRNADILIFDKENPFGDPRDA